MNKKTKFREDVVAGQNNIAPGAQTATFEWNAGDDLHVSVVAVDTMGFRKICINENEPNVTVVDYSQYNHPNHSTMPSRNNLWRAFRENRNLEIFPRQQVEQIPRRSGTNKSMLRVEPHDS